MWDDIINLLEGDLKRFVDAFTLYLNKYLFKNSEKSLICKDNIIYKVIQSIDPNFIQTFNYTEVCDEIYNIGNIKHLHGKAKDSSIILGYEKDNDEYRFANYRKSFQRINKKIFPIQSSHDFNVYDMESSDQMENGEMIMKENLVFFYGFSFDAYDSYYVKHILSNLGENGRIIIYYHNENSKKEMMINLLKIIGNDALYKKYFDSSVMFLKTNIEFSIDKYFCNGYSWGHDK